MGLLDGLLGDVLGSAIGGGQTQGTNNPLGSILSGLSGGGQNQGSNLLMAAMSLLQQNGGLANVLGMFRGNGLTEQADSWVGTGANMNVSPAQIQNIFGTSALNNLATQHRIPQNDISNVLSQLLPEVVNQMSPQGTVPDNHADILSKALGMLSGR